MTELLQVRDLEVQFKSRHGCVYAVNGVSLDLKAGETVGIVGESGCGKSTLFLSLLRLLPEPPCRITAGTAFFEGRDLLSMTREELRALRGLDAGVVFQDPMTSFNPVLTVGYQVSEALRAHLNMSSREAERRAVELLDLVGIPNPRERLRDYPHQFSGGMRQRIMIAIALSRNPKFLVADEPTTALDVTIQAQIVELVKRLRKMLNMAVVWITHDLALLAGVADRMCVMYGGCIVEEASAVSLYAKPRHPYTRGLMGSLPKVNASRRDRLFAIEGTPPSFSSPLEQCPFYPRCGQRVSRCEKGLPPLSDRGDHHKVACWLEADAVISENEPKL